MALRAAVGPRPNLLLISKTFNHIPTPINVGWASAQQPCEAAPFCNALTLRLVILQNAQIKKQPYLFVKKAWFGNNDFSKSYSYNQ